MKGQWTLGGRCPIFARIDATLLPNNANVEDIVKANILARTNNMNKEDWLRYRRMGIGGSDIAAIAGESYFNNALGIYLEKTTNDPKPKEETEAMRLGKVLEPFVASEFALKTDKKVRRVNAILQHPEHPFMLANIDRLIMDKDIGEGVLECKVAGVRTVNRWRGSEIPTEYYLQTQWYLSVTGLQYAWIAVLLGNEGVPCEFIERNEEIINYLIEIGKAFWSMVESRTPPAVDGSDRCSQLLQRLYSQSTPTQIILPEEETVPIIKRYLQASAAEKIAVATKDEAANQLKALMGENELALCDGMQLSWKPVVTKRLDQKLLKDENPAIYEKYSKETTSRRFTVKEAKSGDAN